MKKTILIVGCALFAAWGCFNGTTQTNAQSRSAQAIPAATVASSEQIASMVAKGAFQYGVAIRATTGDSKLVIGGTDEENPTYCGVAAKGIESYFGLPTKSDRATPDSLPCSLYYKIKVMASDEVTAQVRLTVGYTTELDQQPGVSTWNEQVWTVDREVKWDQTETVQLNPPKGKDVPGFEVRFRTRRFEGKLD